MTDIGAQLAREGKVKCHEAIASISPLNGTPQGPPSLHRCLRNQDQLRVLNLEPI